MNIYIYILLVLVSCVSNEASSNKSHELNKTMRDKNSLDPMKTTKESLYVFSLNYYDSFDRWYFETDQINGIYKILQKFNIIGDEPHLLKTIQNYFKEKNNKLEKKDFKMTKQQSSIEIVNIWVEDLIDKLAQLKNFLFQGSSNSVEVIFSKIEQNDLKNYVHLGYFHRVDPTKSNNQNKEIIIPGFRFIHHQIEGMTGDEKPYVVAQNRMHESRPVEDVTLQDKLEMIEKYSQRENYKSNRLLRFLVENKKASKSIIEYFLNEYKDEVKDLKEKWQLLSNVISMHCLAVSNNPRLDLSAEYNVDMIELKRLRDLEKSLNSRILDLAVEVFNNK